MFREITTTSPPFWQFLLPSSPSSKREERMYQAINNNDKSQIIELLSKGVNMDAQVCCGRTFLGRAVELGCVDCIQLILDGHNYFHSMDHVPMRGKCDVNLSDKYEKTPLHYAVELGQIRVIDMLIVAGCLVDVGDFTPLHLASRLGKVKMVGKLIESGCQVNRKTIENALTPLHFAADEGFADVVGLLIQHGANVNARDSSNRTPLFIATSRANHEAMKVLIVNGASVNMEENNGFTPLEKAVRLNDAELVKSLLDAGAKVTKPHHLLHFCVMHRNYPLVKLLLSSGCLINLRDERGDTPLHLAVAARELNIIDELLLHGANVNYPNAITGNKPLHTAVEQIEDHDHQTFAKVLLKLLQYKCNLNANCDTPGDFPLYRAMNLGKFNIAAILMKHGCDVNKGYVCGCSIDTLLLSYRSNNLPLTKMLIYSGFDIKSTVWVNRACDTPWVSHDKGIADWLIYTKSNPMDLSILCRIVIRKNLGQNLHSKISKLILPKKLKHYLFLDDIEEYPSSLTIGNSAL